MMFCRVYRTKPAGRTQPVLRNAFSPDVAAWRTASLYNPGAGLRYLTLDTDIAAGP
jgi:hypothetical protein